MNSAEGRRPVLVAWGFPGPDYVFEIDFHLDGTCDLAPAKRKLAMYGISAPWFVAYSDAGGRIILAKRVSPPSTKPRIALVCAPDGLRHGFIGSDVKDQFYFDGSPLEDLSSRRIFKYSRCGKMLGCSDILPRSHQHNRVGPAGPTFARLHKNGGYFQLNVKPDAVEVIKVTFPSEGVDDDDDDGHDCDDVDNDD